MLKTSSIITAVNEAVCTAFPDLTVYINTIAQDMERPSLYIDLLERTETDAGYNLVDVALSVNIVYFAALTASGISDFTAVYDAQDTLIDLFRNGKLDVDDRSLTITVTGNGADIGEAYVRIDTRFLDDRDREPSHQPMIEDIQLRPKVQGNTTIHIKE